RKSRSRSVARRGVHREPVLIRSVQPPTKESTMSTAPYASRSSTYQPRKEPPSPVAAIVAIFLGLLVGVLGVFALLMWVDAHRARDDATQAAAQAKSAASMPGMDMPGMNMAAGAGPLQSFAGASPANADALAAAHKPYPAALPTAPAGPVANVHLV